MSWDRCERCNTMYHYEKGSLADRMPDYCTLKCLVKDIKGPMWAKWVGMVSKYAVLFFLAAFYVPPVVDELVGTGYSAPFLVCLNVCVLYMAWKDHKYVLGE